MEQKIKSLKGELDHSLGNDLFERIHAHDTSSPLSGTDASWIQVTVNDPSDRSNDDDASWVTAGDQNLENHRKSLADCAHLEGVRDLVLELRHAVVLELP